MMISGEISQRLLGFAAEFGLQTGGPYPLTYDHVILCLGWHHDLSVYAEDVKPIMQPNHKYAVMGPDYESVNVPGLYFAGALAHGKDYKRSAGGFVHGVCLLPTESFVCLLSNSPLLTLRLPLDGCCTKPDGFCTNNDCRWMDVVLNMMHLHHK